MGKSLTPKGKSIKPDDLMGVSVHRVVVQGMNAAGIDVQRIVVKSL